MTRDIIITCVAKKSPFFSYKLTFLAVNGKTWGKIYFILDDNKFITEELIFEK